MVWFLLTFSSQQVNSIHLLNVERRDAEWPNAEWPNAEWPNAERRDAKWPNAEWPNAELDPRPNRDPTSNDQTPNDPTPKGTECRIGLNTEFERQKTECRNSFSQFHMLY